MNSMIKLDSFNVKALIVLETAYWQTGDTDYLEVINEKYFRNIDDMRIRIAYDFIRNIVKYLYMTDQKVESEKIIEQLKQFNIEVVKEED